MTLAGDHNGQGNRDLIRPIIKLCDYLDLTSGLHASLRHTDDPTQLLGNKKELNVGLNFDIKKVLFRDGH